MGRRNGPITVVAWGETIGGVSAALFGFMPNPQLAIATLCICVFSIGAAIALGPVALQSVTSAKIRSQMIALYLFIVNVLGLGIGPSLIAATSDFILQDELAIGKAVSIVAIIVMPFASLILFNSRKRYS
jgi:MFS family permease